MNAYKDFMDRQTLSSAAHQTILEMRQVEEKKTLSWKKYAALAASLALAAALGLFFLRAQPPRTADQNPVTGDQTGLDIPTVPEGPSQGPEISLAGDREAFLAQGPAETGEPLPAGYPAIWGVDYADGATEADKSLVLPDGAFSVPLKKADILPIFWGPEGRPEDADTGDFPLFLTGWSGYLIYGDATYDGKGDLYEVHIWGEKGEDSFDLRAAPGRVPPTCCIVSGAAVTRVVDTDVSAWHNIYDRDGDGRMEDVAECEFIAGGVGVRFETVSAGADAAERNRMFINHACRTDGHLYLGHLLRNENIPDWYTEEFSTLEGARACTGFLKTHADHPGYAAYLPGEGPAGFGEFYGALHYQVGSTDLLAVNWHRGYDSVQITVRRPMGVSAIYAQRALVDVNVPESYDWRLYDGPIWDTVPEAYRENFYCPAFRAEDMTPDVIRARMSPGDTGGARCVFSVLHPDDVTVSYSCSGVSAEYIWSLVEATL